MVYNIVEGVNSVQNVSYTDDTLFNVLNQVQGVQNVYFCLICRSWAFSIYEKILVAQSIKALENKGAFKPLVENYEGKTRVQQLHAEKREAQLFCSECNNLKDKIHSIGVLKKLQMDRAAQMAQNRQNEEEHEGHVVPNALHALPGMSSKQLLALLDEIRK